MDNKENNGNNIKYRRIFLELQKTDIYAMSVDVPIKDDKEEENLEGIKMAWSIINGIVCNSTKNGESEKIDIEKFKIGNGFKNKILKRETIENKK